MTIIPQKRCNYCKQFLPLTDYTRDISKQDGLRTICKVCTKTPKPKLPPVPEGYKRCSQCLEEYPATHDYFHINRASKDGLNFQCRQCNIANTSAYDASHREEIATKQRSRRASNEEKTKEQGRRFRDRHRKELNEKSRKRYSEHRERCKEIDRACRIKHREKYNARAHNYATAHRVERLEYAKAYQKAHPETVKANNHNWNARRKGATGTHTAQQIREQYDRQKGKCYYCRNKVKWGEHHVDHTFPLSREGARNDIDHLVITCAHCNLSKHNKFPWEWPEGNRLL